MTTVTHAVEALVRATVGRSDAQMGEPWVWGVYDEEGQRFALLMTHHELRDLAVRLAAQRPPRTQAQAILAQYHQAYRDLSAVLASASTEDLDRPPGEGEWPLRDVCDHMLGAEYGFLRVCTIGVDRVRAGKAEESAESEWDALSAPFMEARKKASAALASADVEGIRNAFAEIHLRILRDLAGITDGELDAPSWFWDGAMPIRFRLHRFEEHFRQHTIQLDKTLAGIDRPPTEAHRLVRNIYNALADVEMEKAPAEELRAGVAKTIEERAASLAR